MLFLVGLGLSDKDISLGAIDACKRCELYIDRFTSRVSDETLAYIKNATGKNATELSRTQMEENARDIVALSSKKDVAILVGGDPLIATTHKILYIEARRQGIKVRYVHSNSIIISSIGESGLDFYRFGSPCTIPRWTHHYSPVSFYEKMALNLKNNEHTILLLDFVSETGTTMPLIDAASILTKAEEHYKQGIIKSDTRLILLHNIGMTDSKITTISISDQSLDDYKGVNILILPSQLTDIEKEAFEAITSIKW